MKTPQTPANLAIHALAQSLSATLFSACHAADEAREAAQLGDLNLTMGALLPIREQLAAALAQYDAMVALHQQSSRR